jgi:ABC-type lipoprotein export system ATPase subunit
MAAAVPLVQVEDVARRYLAAGGEVVALRGVSLSLRPGMLAVLKGRSGSGKTTLLNLIGGLDRPSRGRVLFAGQDLAELGDEALARLRRERIGFVFQSFALLPTYSAYENVELVLRLAGFGREERASRTRSSLAAVGLEGWSEHRPDELSGGQQQRLAIARALVTRPALILADEPTGELDVAASRQIFALFQRIADQDGIAILVATHDLLVAEYAAEIYELRDGGLASGGVFCNAQVLPSGSPK